MNTEFKLPKEICSIISNYYLSFIAICDDVDYILPLIGKKKLYKPKYFKPKLLKILLNNKNFNYTLISISSILNENFGYSKKITFKNIKVLTDDKRFDPSEDNNYPIRYACFNCYEELVKLFLTDYRVDPSVNNNFCIGIASERGCIKIVELLINHNKVDPSDNGNHAYHIASRRYKPDYCLDKKSNNQKRNNLVKIASLLLKDERVARKYYG